MSNSLETEAMVSKAAEALSDAGSWMKYRTVPLSYTGGNEREQGRLNPCEVRLGILGAFITDENSICRIVLDSKTTEYDVRTDNVMAAIGTGLEWLNHFDAPESDYAKFMVDRVEDFELFVPPKEGASMVAGVQAMFDTEHGEMRPEFIFSNQLEDASQRVRDFCLDLSFEYPGIINNNLAVNRLTNMSVGTMGRLTMSLGQALLPTSIDEFYQPA
jgi:hypothetical protein